MQADIFKDILVPVIGGLGIFMLGLEFMSNGIQNLAANSKRQTPANRLAHALVRNPAGNFVIPSPQTFQAAASSADWKKVGDFDLLLTDMPGIDAYPIVATVFVLMSKDMSAQRRTAALNFFDWSLTQGGAEAAALGYVPLPSTLVAAVKAYWADMLVSPAR
jgi:phosphate transport system substrate-binding protein